MRESCYRNIHSSGHSFTAKALIFWHDKKISNALMEHFNHLVRQQVTGVTLLKVELVKAAFTQLPCRNNQHSTEVIRHKCSCYQRVGAGAGGGCGGGVTFWTEITTDCSRCGKGAALMQIWTCLLSASNLNHPHVILAEAKAPICIRWLHCLLTQRPTESTGI